MASNYKTLSAFEVATAEEAQSYFMDQVIVKVDTEADLASLPNTVKSAYVLNTGVLMSRNVANAWVPMGGVASVGETAPANPQVGQMWVKPSERLPLPVRTMLVTTSVNITGTSWTALGATATFVTSKAVMVNIGFTGLPNGAASTSVRIRVNWSGATTGNTYDQIGGYAGALYAADTTERKSATLGTCLVCAPGTTTFQAQALKVGAGTPTVADLGLVITPVAWADEYVDGVS